MQLGGQVTRRAVQVLVVQQAVAIRRPHPGVDVCRVVAGPLVLDEEIVDAVVFEGDETFEGQPVVDGAGEDEGVGGVDELGGVAVVVVGEVVGQLVEGGVAEAHLPTVELGPGCGGGGLEGDLGQRAGSADLLGEYQILDSVGVHSVAAEGDVGGRLGLADDDFEGAGGAQQAEQNEGCPFHGCLRLGRLH